MLEHLLVSLNVIALTALGVFGVRHILTMLRAKGRPEQGASLLTRMSHELRTPLSAVIGYAEVAREPALPEERREECIDNVVTHSQRLLHLLEDLFDIARSDEKGLSVYPIDTDIRAVIEQVMQDCRPESDRRGLLMDVRVDEDVPQRMSTDSSRLAQVMRSLLDNSLKFTRRGSVGLRVSFLDDLLWIRIYDTGPGLEDHARAKVFTAFQQGDQSDQRKYSGIGIGLTLALRIVEAMGGSIELDTGVGRGCLFTVVLPYRPPKNPWMVPPPGLASPPERPRPSRVRERYETFEGRVLLVEDNPDNRLLMEHLLERMGLEVDSAENGLIALRRASENRYDAILMDMQMPCMDGHTATRELRERGETVPIIAVTAHALTEDRDRCIAAGCDSYLTKPMDRKELESVLKSYLRSAESPVETAAARS